jgi:hypothetical protein
MALLLLLCWLSFMAYRWFSMPDTPRPIYRLAASITLIEIALTVIDRQGAFSVAVYAMGMGLLLIIHNPAKRIGFAPTRQAVMFFRLTGLLSFGAVVFGSLYNRLFAPTIIGVLNGYAPGFGYQQIGISALFACKKGGLFLVSGLSFLFGDLGLWSGILAALLMLAMLLVTALRRRKPGKPFGTRCRRAILVAAAFLLTFAAMWVSSNLMVVRHPYVLWPDVIRGIYFYPFSGVIAFFLLLCLDSIGQVPFRYSRYIALIFLAGILAANLASIPRAKNFWANGHIGKNIAETPVVLKCLRDPRIDPGPLLLYPRSERLIRFFRNPPATETVQTETRDHY